MIVGIANVHLYTALSATAGDSFAAKEALDTAGVDYTHLHYADAAQHGDVLAAVSTWFPEAPALTAFPFLVYDERHDDYSVVKRLLAGKSAILAAIDEEVLT